MLKTLRTNTKWIMVIVAVCFIGMIIFAWGMDITGRRSGVQAGIVGSINGEDVPKNVYDNYIKNQRQMYAGNSRVTLDQERRIHEETWNTIVSQTVISQDIRKRDIQYTDRELVNFMRTNPPQFVNQEQLAPLFRENNQFSISKYQAFLNPENLKNPQTAQILNYIEMDARNRLPAMKFQESLTSGVKITEAQVRERWLRENEKRNVDWLFVNANTVTAVGTTVDPSEVRAYFESHKNDYTRGKRRILASVFFRLAATAQDSADVIDQAEMLVERTRSGADFAELANEYTDDPGNTDGNGIRQGGNLGFFAKGRMIPAFEEVAFSLKPGEISDPVITRFGCHVIKVDSIRYKQDDPKTIDQVKARHILLNIDPSGNTRESIESAVTSFREAVQEGTDFLIRAQMDSLEVLRTFPFENEAQAVPGLQGSSLLLVHRAYEAKVGEVLPVFVTDAGYYIMRVEDELPDGVPPFEEVQNEVERDFRREIRAAFTEEVVKRIHARMQGGMSLKEAVETDDYKEAQVSSGEVYRSYYVPGLGSMNALMASIFTLDNSGDTTGPVVTEFGTGIAVLNSVIPVQEDLYEEARTQLKRQMESELKNDVISRYVDSLVESADIVDHRHIFLGL